MVEGVRMGVTSLHGTPLYLLYTVALARSLVQTHTNTQAYEYIYGLIIAPVQLKKEA